MHHDHTTRPTRATAQRQRVVRPGALSLASLAALVVALSVRDRVAPPPPLITPDRLGSWWSANEAIDLVAGAAGLAVVVILSYLVLVGALAAMANRVPGTWLARVARACTPRVLGAVLAGTVALAPTSIATAADGPTPGPSAPGSGATMRVVDTPSDDTGASTTSTSSIAATRFAAAPDRRTWLPWADGAAPRTVDDPDDPDETAPAQQRTVDPPAQPDEQDTTAPLLDASPLTPTRNRSVDLPPSSYTVRPGDHLWSIAEQVVVATNGDRSGPAPTDRQVGRYWRLLIDANSDRVVDPDVILPGQELALPPVPR